DIMWRGYSAATGIKGYVSQPSDMDGFFAEVRGHLAESGSRTATLAGQRCIIEHCRSSSFRTPSLLRAEGRGPGRRLSINSGRLRMTGGFWRCRPRARWRAPVPDTLAGRTAKAG